MNPGTGRGGAPQDFPVVDRLPSRTSRATLHRLLGLRPGDRSRFRHHRGNRLPHDLVLVDETSMVSLTKMTRLLEAVRPTRGSCSSATPTSWSPSRRGRCCRTFAVPRRGFAGGLPSRPRLRTSTASATRSAPCGRRAGGRRGPCLRAARWESPGQAPWSWPTPPTRRACARSSSRRQCAARRSACAGDEAGALAALQAHRLLCAHREGPWGVGGWNHLVERWLQQREGLDWFPDPLRRPTADRECQRLPAQALERRHRRRRR